MAGIEDWKTAGVDLRVYLSTAGDLVLPSVETPIAFNPGGPSGVPSGWVFYKYAPGTMPNNVTASTSSGIFRVGAQTPGYNAITAGAQSFISATPNKLFQLRVKCRLQSGHNDSRWNVGLDGWNPVNSTYYPLASVSNWDATSEWVMAACTASKVLPAQYTQLRLSLTGTCKNQNEGTTYNWGVEFTDLVLVEFDPSASVPEWRDITCDVQSLAYRYGRERFTNRYDVATINLVLRNDDGEYSYANPHPFNLEPGRLVKVEATYAGTMYPQAFGVVDQLTDGVSLDGRALTNVVALDPTSIFSNRPTPQLPSTYDADLRMTAIVKYLGYPRYAFDNGVWAMQEIQSSGRSLRDEMGITADSEGGSVFADREGNIVYKNRNWITTDPNIGEVTANLWAKPAGNQVPFDETTTQPSAPEICLNRLVTDWGMSRVVNYVELANAGGTLYVYQNNASQRKYGPRTYSRRDFVLDLGYADDFLKIRAADIMTGYDVPKLRLNSVGYRPGVDGNDWGWTLRVFLNWLVRVWYQNARTGWGWLIVTHVQSIEHRITPTEWEVSFSLDQPTYYADAPIMVQAFWDGTKPTDLWDVGLWS